MQTYISILRGINVGGKKKILMSELKALYEDLGFENVKTYIQSGNVIFRADTNYSDLELADTIEQAIEKVYRFKVPVIIRSTLEMDNVLLINPFLQQEGTNKEKLHVTFLDRIPEGSALEAIEKYDHSPDKFIIIGCEIYVYCPNGYGTTKLNNNFFENKLKVKATTRNWKTVNTLAEMARS